jgi:hypothetical protein
MKVDDRRDATGSVSAWGEVEVDELLGLRTVAHRTYSGSGQLGGGGWRRGDHAGREQYDREGDECSGLYANQ